MNAQVTFEQYRNAARKVPWRVRSHMRLHALAAGKYLLPLEEIRLSSGTGPCYSLIAVGDVAGCSPVEEIYLEKGRRAWGPVLPVLESADLCVGNLEAVLTDRRQPQVPCGAALRVDPKFVASLEGVFDGFTAANNHVMDYGPEALLESSSHLRAAGIAVCGTGENEDQSWQPSNFQVGDVQVAMLGCCDRYSFLEGVQGSVTPALCDPEATMAAIRAARNGGADVVILQVHWGYEFSLWPLARHRHLARSFVDAGADLVLCHHAHVPMGIEARGRGVITYGLGNFLFRQDDYQRSGSPWSKRSYLLRVEFDKTGVRRAEPVPVELAADYQVELLEGSARREVLGVLGHISRRIEDTAGLENLEHHCRMQEVLMFMERFRPAENQQEARFRAGLLHLPVWRDTIEYLKTGSNAVRETADLLERIGEAARNGRGQVDDFGEPVRQMAGRLSAEVTLMPTQPATTPWWLL